MADIETIWEQLDSKERDIFFIAALIPPPITLDFWAKASSAPSVKVLQLAEQLIQLDILATFEPLGAGHYFFCDPDIIQDIVSRTKQEEIQKHARQLIALFETDYPPEPKRWMALAYIYQVSNIDEVDPANLIRAVQYCLENNLKDDALIYQELLIELMPVQLTSIIEKTNFVDAAIVLCQNRGNVITLHKQEAILARAHSYLNDIDDPKRTIQIFVLSGLLYIQLDNYERAAELLDDAWKRANIFGQEELLKMVALANAEVLVWNGFMAEAIERYEEVLGNLEELPSNERMLRACTHLGWIYGKYGQTERGLGLIKSVLQKAETLQFDDLIIYSKAWAVITLYDARRHAEAQPIIDELFAEPLDNLDHYTLRILYTTKAHSLTVKGKFKESLEILDLSFERARSLGKPYYSVPFDFDCLELLEDGGYHHPHISYDSEADRLIHLSDISLQGLGYYYRAKKILKKKGKTAHALRDLKKSMTYLSDAGDKLDLSFTQILLGRLLIQEGQPQEAEPLLEKAWAVLKFVNDELFPADLKHIVVRENHTFSLEALLEVSNSIGSLRTRQELLNKIINLTMRLTGAERGAFFVPKTANSIEMIASRNLTTEVIQAAAFKHPLAAIDHVIGSGKEIFASENSDKNANKFFHSLTGWQVAYPVKLQDKVLGCFYLERNLNGFVLSNQVLSLLNLISTQVAVALDNVSAYEEIAELKDQLEAETLFYRRESSKVQQTQDIVGESPGIKDVVAKILNVASSDATVLITGETGTGKDLVAKAIHRLGNHSTGPFIPVSIASLSESLIPSELFGHEKGAFTDAVQSRRGRFELAQKGTLFLDEINSLSPDTQAILLRVLEDKTFERVGGSTTIQSGFRLITACNQRLDKLLKTGAFRSDLYYRLNVYPIYVPPLRERKEDIPLLVNHFVLQYNKKFNKQIDRVAKKGMQYLKAYHWPGNVRELKHTVERAVITCMGRQLNFPNLNLSESKPSGEEFFLTYRDNERNHIIKALEQCNWKVSGKEGAAKLLDLNPNTLYTKIRRLGIKKRWS